MSIPFNAIIGRLALYRFMAVAHYGYLVVKMPSPAGVLTVREDRSAALATVEKLHALAMEVACSEGSDPSALGAKVSPKMPKVPKVHLSDSDDVPVKMLYWWRLDHLMSHSP